MPQHGKYKNAIKVQETWVHCVLWGKNYENLPFIMWYFSHLGFQR